MKLYADFTWFIIPFYYLAKILGLAPFVFKDKKLYPAGLAGKTYAIILIALNIKLTIEMDKNLTLPTKDLFDSIIISIFIYFLAARAFVSLLTLAFKSDEIIDTWNRINAVDDELRSFDQTQETQEGCRKNKILAKIIATNLIVVVLKVVLYSMKSSSGFDVIFESIVHLGNIAMVVIGHTTLMMFVETLNSIKRNFESLNKQLHDIFRPKHAMLLFSDMQHCSIFPSACRQHQLPIDRFDNLRNLHRELGELVECNISVMSVPIFVTGVYFFTQLLSSCYFLYTMISGYNVVSEGATILGARYSIVRISVAIFELSLIADACSSTCTAGNATNGVLIELWNEFHPQEMRDEFFMFTFQLLHNPVSVIAFGFLDLGYSFIYKIFYTVVTYSIIMIQLDRSELDRHT